MKAGGKGKRKAKGKATPKKKRKMKNDDLDGFVVDGESESNALDDITDSDEDFWLVRTLLSPSTTILFYPPRACKAKSLEYLLALILYRPKTIPYKHEAFHRI